jgi:hypothetical protein
LITFASSSSAAVSAALPVASGTDCESRAAMITICSRLAPGRRATTFTSGSPFSSQESTLVSKPSGSSARKRSASSRATAALASAPGRRSGRRLTISRSSRVATSPSKSTSAARPCGTGFGRFSSENITSTTASTAGMNAAR